MTVSVGSRSCRNPTKHLVLTLILVIFLHFFPMTGNTQASAKPFPFNPGEKLTYRAKWGPIAAGELTLEVLPIETIGGVKHTTSP